MSRRLLLTLAQILLKCRQAFGHKTSSAPANSPENWGLSRLIQRDDELKGDPQTFDYLRVAGNEMVADITNSDRETRISVASGSTIPHYLHTMSLYMIPGFRITVSVLRTPLLLMFLCLQLPRATNGSAIYTDIVTREGRRCRGCINE